MIKHTPLPWKVSKNSQIIFGSDGFQICDVEQGPHISEQWEEDIGEEYRFWADNGKDGDYREPPEEEIEANAKLIVKCVNSHDDLLASVKMLQTILKNSEYHNLYKTSEQCRNVEAIINKAEGKLS